MRSERLGGQSEIENYSARNEVILKFYLYTKPSYKFTIKDFLLYLILTYQQNKPVSKSYTFYHTLYFTVNYLVSCCFDKTTYTVAITTLT